MNPFFSESRTLKFCSPSNGNIYNIDMTGNENEIRELISAIISVKPSSIKGFTDNNGNYYTIASILRTCHFNTYNVYYPIINNTNDQKRKDSNLSTPLSSNETPSLPQFTSFGNINNNNNNNFFTPEPFNQNNPFVPSLNFNNIRQNFGNNNNFNINIKSTFIGVANKLYDSGFVSFLDLEKLKQLILSDHSEIIKQFHLYLTHNRIDFLYSQISPILASLNFQSQTMNQIQPMMPMFNSSMYNQNMFQIPMNYQSERNYYWTAKKYFSVLDEIKSSIKDTKDWDILKNEVLIAVNAEQDYILKALVKNSNPNNRNDLISNFIRITKERRFAINNSKFNPISASDRADKSGLKTTDRNTKKITVNSISDKIKDYFSEKKNILRYDYQVILKNVLTTFNKKEKKELFFDSFGFPEDCERSMDDEILNKIEGFCVDRVQTLLLSGLNSSQKEIYDKLIQEDNKDMLAIFKQYMVNQNENILKKSIEELVYSTEKAYLKATKQINGEDEDDDENEDSEEDEEEEDGNVSFKLQLHNMSSSREEDKKDLKKKTTDSSSGVLNLISANDNQEGRNQKNNEQSINKSIDEFIRILESMKLPNLDVNLVKMSIQNNSNPRLTQEFQNYCKKPTFINKISIQQAIASLYPQKEEDNSFSESDSEPPESSNRGNNKSSIRGGKPTFEGYIRKKYKENELDRDLSTFLIMNYQNKVQVIMSIWQSYCDRHDEKDLKESLELYGKECLKQALREGLKLNYSLLEGNSEPVTSGRPKTLTKQEKKNIIIDLYNSNLYIKSVSKTLFDLIEKNNEKLNMFFEVYQVNKDEGDLIESLSVFLENMKTDEQEDKKESELTKKFNKILNSGNFNESEKEKLRNAFNSENETIMSIVSASNPNDMADAIDSLRLMF